MNPTARQKLKEQYQDGIKAAWGVVTGSGVLALAKEVAKGEIIKQGKQKVGALILLGCSHVGLGAVTLVTNSTKILKYAKKTHSLTSCNDASDVVDFVIFGEYADDGYQLFNVSSDAKLK